jgi:predicted GIY-YIG superfamily endonuclease
MAAYVYILQCSDGSYYVGSTFNLEKRLEEHLLGAGSAYTRTRLPVKLLYSEEFSDVGKAYLREKQIQGWSRAKREALMAGDFERLKLLSKSKSS